jgi:erythromycin esterase-like protein
MFNDTVEVMTTLDAPAAVRAFVETHASIRLLAIGEPTHGEPTFPRLRNRIFATLVEHGFRSIAVESDRVAALTADAYVSGDAVTLDSALAGGFSHGFGQLDANRELLSWMRSYNGSRPAAQRLAFYGFDAPLEMTSAPSPRRYLVRLHEYLTEHLDTDAVGPDRDVLERLLGDDERWSDPAALMDAGRSVGASSEAAGLSAATDDLLTTLLAQAPRLVAGSSLADWRRAEVHGRTALGLLRYHAEAARAAPPAQRTSRLLGVRDALMARHLLDIRLQEQHRGPTLVFAHNRHLQRHPSTWRLSEMDLEWNSAGAIVATLLEDGYAVVVGSLGESLTLGLAAPAQDTFEGAVGDRTFVARAALAGRMAPLRTRTDVGPEQGLFPLDAATIEHSDAVLHVASAELAPAELAERILTLPGVAVVLADAASGAPEISWGDRFFFAGADRRQPFATIVERDVPGFDEESGLDRPSVYRLNIQLGRAGFERAFGYPPAEFQDHRAELDFTVSDTVLPHPVYATHGWACILNPTGQQWPEVHRLMAYALDRRRQAR